MINREFILLLLLVTGIVSTAFPQKGNSLIRSGNELYEQGKIDEAYQKYEQALEKDPDAAEALNNKGLTLFKQEKYEEATGQLEAAATLADDPKLQAQAHFNAGNAYMAQQKFKQAVEQYKSALRADPTDKDAKYNLAYAMKMMNNPPPDQQKEEEENSEGENEEEKNKPQDQDGENNKQEGENQEESENDEEGSEGESNEKPKPGEQNEGDADTEQPEQGMISKEYVDQLLKDSEKEDSRVRAKMMKQKRAKPQKIDKDW